MSRKRLTSRVSTELQNLLGKRWSTSRPVCEAHATDESSFHNKNVLPPEGVAKIQSTVELSKVMKLCSENLVPMIPFGAGTSLEGHIHATNGCGITLDLSDMTSVLSISESPDSTAKVQAGVTRQALDHACRATGLFFPVDPGAEATLGGMASTNASGTTTVMYGNMKSNVLGMTVVLADGTIIKTGSSAKKTSAGYDLTSLLIGSEGTLGVITELELRLSAIPENVCTGVFSFPSIKAAVDTCANVMAVGSSTIPVARMELLDHHAMAATNAYSKLSNPISPSLLLELHGSDNFEDAKDFVSSVASENGASNVAWASGDSERKKLWEARHNAWYAVKVANPNRIGLSTDVCVPISHLTQVIVETQEDLEKSLNGQTGIVGHVGDGNFHVFVYADEGDASQLKDVQNFYDRLVTRALRVGGTCTGEHGIGDGKMNYLMQEHGKDAVNVMHTIKKALDPNDLLNPGKVFYGDL